MTARAIAETTRRSLSPPNDVRIDCKAAKHGDGDRGTPLAPYSRMEMRAACRPRARIALVPR